MSAARLKALMSPTFTLIVLSLAISLVDAQHMKKKGSSTELYPKEGANVTLPCVIEGISETDVYSITWQKDGKLISQGPYLFADVTSYSLPNSPSRWDLVITGVNSPRHVGSYSCNYKKEKLEIYVHVQTPLTLVMTPNSSPVIVTVGDTVDILCDAEGNPPPAVMWTREDQTPLPQELFSEGQEVSEFGSGESLEVNAVFTEYFGENLFMENVTMAVAGTYVCAASVRQTDEVAEASVELRVELKPEIKKPSQVIHARQGSKVYLVCEFKGKPEVMITWYKGSDSNYQQVLADSRTEIYSEGSNLRYESMLSITNVRSDDMDVYTCVGTNSHGAAEAFIQLTGEPFAVELSSNSIGYKHDAIFLMWTTKSYAPILSYIVLYRAEEDINKPWKRINVPAEKSDGSENHYGSFEITGLHPDSVYQIQIQAKNQHGVSRIEDTWELRTQPEGKEVEKPQSRPRLGTDVSRHLDRNSQGSISSSSRPTFTRVSGFLAFLCAAVISL